MNKLTYMAFTEGMVPRFLTNPSEEILASYEADQIVKRPNLKKFAGVPIHLLVLEEGVIKKANEKEIIEINKIISAKKIVAEDLRRNKEVEDYRKQVEKKMREICNIVDNQASTLEDYKKALSKARVSKKLVLATLLSLVGNAILLYGKYEAQILELIK